MDRMKSGLVIAVFVAFSVVALTAVPIVQASPSVIHVPENYTLIQDAVDAASSGDTIIVKEGTYKENILVDKSITIKSENGPDSTVVRAEYPDLPVFEVAADYVNISGFTVKGAYEEAGIYLYTADYCTISNNICCDNKYGIHLLFSKDNLVRNNNCTMNLRGIVLTSGANKNELRNNTACENSDEGLQIQDSEENIVTHNSFSRNIDGIVLFEANKNELRNNTASENSNEGLQIQDSEENIVTHNSFSRNIDGIVLFEANKNELRNNTASENSNEGLQIQDSEENIVTHNSLSMNLNGIVLIEANKNELRNNSACENRNVGLQIQYSEENIVTHNSLSMNSAGIILFSANKNELWNNTACENGDVGLQIEDSEENIVTHNSLSMNLHGILLLRANKNELRNNTACENRNVGLKIHNSEENIVTHNSLSRNLYGIVLSRANKNELRNNTACENSNVGLQIHDSEENIVTHNSLSKNLDGIVLLRANKNELQNNTACENSDEGLQIEDSEENIVAHNSLSKNSGGIVLLGANKNELRNNTACENSDVGLQIQQNSTENLVTHNSLSKNSAGIVLTPGANKNELRNNNLVDSKADQVWIQNSSLNNLNYNYWSDYEAQYPDAQEKSNTDIGDIPYEIDEANKDDCPYLSYSGWLNVVVTPEYWEFSTKKGDVNYFYNNFSIENRLNSPTEVEILLEQNLEFVTDSERATTKTFSIDPKSTENITLRLNVTNLEGYILRTITFKTEDYTKPTLVHGLVQPKINAVKIEGVDYHRNVVLGQINPFNVILRNHGDRDEFEVTLKMGSEEIKKSVYLNESENKTIPFEIDTSDMPLDINQGQVAVTKDNRLDYLNLTMFVAEKREASTLIVTNLERMREKWGNDSVDKLKAKLIDLSVHPGVNGIIVSVGNETNCSKLYEAWDRDNTPEKANEIATIIKSLIDTKRVEYPNTEYLVIVGDDRIIPFYRIFDRTDFSTEKSYDELINDSTVGFALFKNTFLTDNFYAAYEPVEWRTTEVHIPALFIPNIPVSRLVETTEQISAVIDAFYRGGYVHPEKIFVSGYDFMYDTALYCSSTLEERMKTKPVTIVSQDDTGLPPGSVENATNRLLNISNDVILIFYHATHYCFRFPDLIYSRDISTAPADLNGSIVYTMGCHSGLNVPPDASENDFDLVEAFAQKGVVAYIAPTGYGIGSYRIKAAHELLLSYFTNYLCDGIDVGTALTLAKQEYWATRYDFSYVDEQVLETTTLYGLPMVKVIIPHNTTKHNVSVMAVKTEVKTEEEPDTLTIRPWHVLNITRDGDYYISPDGELYSYLNKPILPKKIRVFHPTHNSVLRGAVLHSSKYHVDEPFKQLVEGYEKSDYPSEPVYVYLKDWFPARIFKLNSISYPGPHAESRQYLVIITAQYKGPVGPPMRQLLFGISDREVVADLNSDLNKGTITEKLRNIFVAKGYPLSENVTTTIIKRGDNEWTITDKDKKILYAIQKSAGELFISEEKGGEERIYDELSFDLYYASPNSETDIPRINNVSNTIVNGNIRIAVNASDESEIQRVLITYTDSDGTWGAWRSEDCKQREGDMWGCTIYSEEEIEFFVQVVDVYGNVAVDDNDGEYHP